MFKIDGIEYTEMDAYLYKKENDFLKNKISNLQNALECLKDEYVKYVDNACHCNEYDETELCPYCNAKEVLKETK